MRSLFKPLGTCALLLTLLPTLGQPPRREPPLSEILSGKVLNERLRDIAAAHAKGRRGPRVPLYAALLKHINLAPPGGGSFGLLKNGGKLTWPRTLTTDTFRKDRTKVDQRVLEAVQALRNDPTKSVGKVVAGQLEQAVKALIGTLEAEVAELTVAQYIESRRYLNSLASAVKALKSPTAGNYLNGTYAAQGTSVEELVEHVRRHSLEFAPAIRGEEKSYRDLYNALAVYHAGLSR